MYYKGVLNECILPASTDGMTGSRKAGKMAVLKAAFRRSSVKKVRMMRKGRNRVREGNECGVRDVWKGCRWRCNDVWKGCQDTMN